MYFLIIRYCGDSFPKGKISTSKFGEPNLMMLKLDTKSVSGLPQVGGFRIRGKAYNAYKGNNQGILNLHIQML